MFSLRALFVLLLGFAMGCGDDDRRGGTDAGRAFDGGRGFDSGPGFDGGPGFDAGPMEPECDGIPLIVDGVLDLDLQPDSDMPVVGVTRITVQGSLTMDMAPLTRRPGRILFRSDNGGSYEAEVSGDSYSVIVAPGTYSVDFQAEEDCAQAELPCTGGVLVPNVGLTTDGVLDLDIPTASIRGALRLDGMPMPASDAVLVFSSDHSSGRVSADAMYDIRVFRGAYDVEYQHPGRCAAGIPCDSGVLRAGANLTADGVLDFDISGFDVQGEVRQDGGTMPDANSRGQVCLSDAACFDLGSSGPARYAATVLGGEYTLSFHTNSDACRENIVPCGGGVERTVNISSDGVLDLEYTTVMVNGALTYEGGVLPDEGQSRGTIEWGNEEGSSFTTGPLGATGPATFAVRVIPGTYQVRLRRNASLCRDGTPVASPCLDAILSEGINLSASGVIDFDISTALITGRVTVNGATPAAGMSVSFSRSDADSSGGSFDADEAGNYAVRVPKGSYDVSVRADSCEGTTVPCGSARVAMAVPVQADGVLDFDGSAVSITGRVTIRGEELPPAPTSRRGRVRFDGVLDGQARIDIPASAPAMYQVWLWAENYAIRWDGERELCDVDTTIPCQDQEILGCESRR